MFIQEFKSLNESKYKSNAFLLGLTRRFLPHDIYYLMSPKFENLSDEINTRVNDWALKAEHDLPRLHTHNAFGKRIDDLYLSEGWKKLKEFSLKFALISSGYDKKLKESKRVVQAVMQILFSAHSSTYSCPLAMTDGAITVLNKFAPKSIKETIVPKLLGKEKKSVTCGQWMTEQIGGSDLRQIETHATFNQSLDDQKIFRLYGLKWFASSIDSEYALVLAQVQGKGLSLFLLRVWQDNNLSPGIKIERLKNKLGTKALPTAEVSLEGAKATLIGQEGEGIRCGAPLLNVTRLYNAYASASLMNKAFFVANDYAKVRHSFNKPIAEHSLHKQVLASIDAKRSGAIALVLEIARLFGKMEEKTASDTEKKMVRVLTPIAKLMLGKWAVNVASESIEALGGIGYIEDSTIPSLLRDAQVFPIWEGCTNILIFDVLRAQEKEQALVILLKSLCERVNKIMIDETEALRILKARLKQLSEKVIAAIRKSEHDYPIYLEPFARKCVFSIGACTMAILLAEAKPFVTDNDGFTENRFTTFVETNLCGNFSL